MFRRQLRLAWLPSLPFSVCAVLAICHHDTSEGSATGGYVRDGHYFLSLGHGAYQETDATRFAAIRRNEWIVIGSLAGAVASALVTAHLVRRAGLPIRADEYGFQLILAPSLAGSLASRVFPRRVNQMESVEIVPPLPPLLRPKPRQHKRTL